MFISVLCSSLQQHTMFISRSQMVELLPVTVLVSLRLKEKHFTFLTFFQLFFLQQNSSEIKTGFQPLTISERASCSSGDCLLEV